MKMSYHSFALLVSLILVASISRANDKSRLVGTWVFQREVDTLADGSSAPAGAQAPDYNGLLTYTDDGFVSVVIMPRGRKWASDAASLAELRDTVSSGTAYAGRYELDERHHVVTHIPAVSVEPGYEDKKLARSYSFVGDTLQLSGTFDYHGQVIHFRLTWARPNPKETVSPNPSL